MSLNLRANLTDVEQRQGESMGTEKKSTAQVEAESQDEIEKIMSEIESLQQEATPSPAVEKQSRPQLKAVPTAATTPERAQEPSADFGIEDFHGSADDASMEETLGHMAHTSMKEEESGNSLLDMETEPMHNDESNSEG